MSSQIQTIERTPPDREPAPDSGATVLKFATSTDTPVVAPVRQGMMSQPASLYGNESMPQMLIRLTGTYSPVTPPASWRRPRRTPDAA